VCVHTFVFFQRVHAIESYSRWTHAAKTKLTKQVHKLKEL
jgi:hypothetical protein